LDSIKELLDEANQLLAVTGVSIKTAGGKIRNPRSAIRIPKSKGVTNEKENKIGEQKPD
jgi:hypothetical protein